MSINLYHSCLKFEMTGRTELIALLRNSLLIFLILIYHITAINIKFKYMTRYTGLPYGNNRIFTFIIVVIIFGP